MTQQGISLINNVDQAKKNIRQFQIEMESPQQLVGLLGVFQAWYAIADDAGGLLFAPSKFIGYQDLTAQTYREAARETNGRDTEAVLSRWFKQPEGACEQVLIQELAKWLGRFGKKPNRSVRISTVQGATLIPGMPATEALASVTPVDAMMVFFQMLSAGDQREFRRRITR
ncbi:hypothetical protein DQ403_13165 [Stutzerimonas zhaodongensis]|uniref:Uncharacterized protein n=1 Tax=Stutzerimonas zhaodongensis TaxID=1176257 RepID=A0A365PT89_9GAMM|nr:hypothetical protein [Stutzerimonas zhaodongensis]RBA56861.1 hypothetical protein DQ403_13165 [Stutzerimonas zhaodongensis]